MCEGEEEGKPSYTDSLPGVGSTRVSECLSVSTRGSTCRIMLQVPPQPLLLLHLPHHLPLGPTHFVPGHVRVNDWGVAASSGALIASSVRNVIQERREKERERAEKGETAERREQKVQ